MSGLPPQHRILIVSSNTGGGHASAAKALAESFQRLGTPQTIAVSICNVLEEANFFSRQCARLYNVLLRHCQHGMRYYYTAIEWLKPNESKLLLAGGLQYGKRLYTAFQPTIVISVHPMTQHFLANVHQKLGLGETVPLVTVVTDPYDAFWKGWACTQVNRYFVASQAARAQLVAFGIPASRITVLGMPVHHRFTPLTAISARHLLKVSLGLQPSLFTVVVNAGWVGGGNFPVLCKALLTIQSKNLQFIFLTGRNRKLFRQVEKWTRQSNLLTHVIGYTDEMVTYLQAADVLVSKLGGLTTFEAMACGLPILADCITPPMPQEAATAKYIEQLGAGILIKTAQQAIDTLLDFADHPEKLIPMQKDALSISPAQAADKIATAIIEMAIPQ